MSKRRHNFGTKRFKEKSLFIFHARIALKSLILLFVRLIARGARIGKTHRHRQNEKHQSANPQHNLTEMLHVLGEQTGMKLSCIKPRQKSEVYL